MTLRKGQHLFNKIAESQALTDHKCTMNKDRLDLFPYVNLHMILYYMLDDEFDKIMSALPNSKSVEGKNMKPCPICPYQKGVILCPFCEGRSYVSEAMDYFKKEKEGNI